MENKIVIRAEEAEHIEAVRSVEKLAFAHDAEADLVDALRARGLAMISLVALVENRVVGHVLFSPVTIVSETGRWSAVGMGPLAVVPAHQHQGIGSRLVRAGIEECRQVGHGAVVVLGSSEYYPRFGFQPAAHFGLCFEGTPAEHFMAMELRRGALDGKSGSVHYQPEFDSV